MTQRKTKASNGNVLVIYGGGLNDCACIFVRELCDAIYKKTETFEKIFVGFYSFRSLTEDGLILEWTQELSDEAKNSSSGFFGTCRATNFVKDEDLMAKAIATCKNKNITHILLAGGDGSSHHMAGIAEEFYRNGICWIFAMPMTIDGITGGYSLGLKSATAASVDVINKVASTCLRTLDANKYPAVIFKLMGRNRDDIIISVLRELLSQERIAGFARAEVEIIVIPANLDTNAAKLKEKLNSIGSENTLASIKGKPLLILLSEGAQLSEHEILDMAKNSNIKMRFQEIGYLSQVNSLTSPEEEVEIRTLVKKIVHTVADCVEPGKVTEAFSVVFEDENSDATIMDSQYFAKNNPQSGYQPLKEEDCDLLRSYMII